MGIRVPERQLDGFLRPVTDKNRDLTMPDIIMQISHRYQTTPKRFFSCAEVVANPWILVVREVSLILLDVAEDIETPLLPLGSLPALLATF